MSRARTVLRAGAAVIAVGCLITAGFSLRHLVRSRRAWAPLDARPPVDVWFGGPPVDVRDSRSDFACAVEYAADHLILAAWFHLPSGSYGLQELAISYWPTAIAPAEDELEFHVAGKRDSGATVIERWKLQPPTVVERISATTGQMEHAWTFHAPASVTTLYDAAHEGMDMVESMTEYPGPHDELVIKFYDSNAVMRMDPAGGHPPELVASPDPPAGSGAFEIPELVELQNVIVRFQHVDYGYVLYLTQPSRAGIDVALYDADLDGHIDGFVTIETVEDWVASGLADGSKIVVK